MRLHSLMLPFWHASFYILWHIEIDAGRVVPFVVFVSSTLPIVLVGVHWVTSTPGKHHVKTNKYTS